MSAEVPSKLAKILEQQNKNVTKGIIITPLKTNMTLENPPILN